jgi:predicted metal-dependent peptidase
MSKLTAEEKIERARIQLVMQQPFFATLALRLSPKREDIQWFIAQKLPPSCATDGKYMYYCDEFIEELSVPQVTGLMCHEALHVGMLHHTRRGSRETNRWQHATDYAVNQICEESKLTLPEGALTDKKFKDMSAEEIYQQLPDMSEQPQQSQGTKGAGMGSIMDAPGTEAERQAQEAEWKEAMQGAIQAGKLAGQLPTSMERIAQDLNDPKVDWGTQLRQYLTDKQRSDDDWNRPNRRFAHRGLILPTVREIPTGELVIAVDTSGSIDQKTLNAFQTEIRTIAYEVRPEKITVIYCDAAINRVQEFEKDEKIELKMCGGGGTDFNPPFRWVDDRNMKPHALIYLTDGYGPFPSEPDYPTVWCMITDVQPPFGHIIRVEIDEYN